MRLINANTIELEEFWGEIDKPYAILSHRWEDGEVSFQNMQNLALASVGGGASSVSCRDTPANSF